MPTTTGHDTLWVCLDCYFTAELADGFYSPMPDREPLSLIPAGAVVTAGLVRDEHSEDCPVYPLLPDGTRGDAEAGAECECERHEFSWSRCEGCGSTLGGSREALTVWS